MTDTAAISALVSAAAVVGALTTSSIVTWYVEVSQLAGEVLGRTAADKADDDVSRALESRRDGLDQRRRALLWVAVIQWAVVASLLATALWLAWPECGPACDRSRLPFVFACLALIVALVILPVTLTLTASRRLRTATSHLAGADS